MHDFEITSKRKYQLSTYGIIFIACLWAAYIIAAPFVFYIFFTQTTLKIEEIEIDYTDIKFKFSKSPFVKSGGKSPCSK
jgi:hypothetical protein